MCVLAAGMALTMTPMTTQLMAAVPRDRAGMGSATNDTTRELGGALGVAVLGSLLAEPVHVRRVRRRWPGCPRRLASVAEGSIGGVRGPRRAGRGRRPTRLLDVASEAFVDGLHLAATVGAVIVVAAALVVKRYLPSDRNDPEITGEPRPTAVGID